MALAVLLAGAAQRHALVHRHVVADYGGFTDDHPHGVVDEQPPSQLRAGVNINAGEEAGDLREQPRQQAQLHAPEGVGEALNPDCPQSWVAGENLDPRTSGRITLEHGVDVFANAGEERHGRYTNCAVFRTRVR